MKDRVKNSKTVDKKVIQNEAERLRQEEKQYLLDNYDVDEGLLSAAMRHDEEVEQKLKDKAKEQV